MAIIRFVFSHEFLFHNAKLHVCTQLPVEMLYITCNVDISELLKCFQMKGLPQKWDRIYFMFYSLVVWSLI